MKCLISIINIYKGHNSSVNNEPFKMTLKCEESEISIVNK